MFFHGLVRRRLESILQPWLREQPEIDIELGFINSRITVKNLIFDSAALNRLLTEPSRFSCKELRVEELSVRFSCWSVPACKIEVRSLNITLLAGEENEQGSSVRARKWTDKVTDDKKKVVAEIDPEGSALHDLLERISRYTPSKNSFSTSLLNLMLKHCHMQIFTTNLQVLVPILNDALVYLFELKEFDGVSQNVEHGCLLTGFFIEVFSPSKETSIAMDFKGFGLSYEMEYARNSVFTTDIFSCIKLDDLQLSDLSIRVPELNVLLSPQVLYVLSLFANLPSKESKCARNGRQLWRLVANRIGNAISSPRLSLHNLVEFVCLWLRYLNAYENFLTLLGYSAANILRKKATTNFRDKMFLGSVNQSWEVISRIEKDLPAEAIAQARRIARYRTIFDSQHFETRHKNLSEHGPSKILTLFVVAWSVIYRVFSAIIHGFASIMCFFQDSKSDRRLGNISQDHCPEYCFLLNFGKILVTFSPSSIVYNIYDKTELLNGISHSDMQSFCLSIDALLFVYVDAIFEQSFSLSCGLLKLKSSTVIMATNMESSSDHHFSSVQGDHKMRTDNLKTVLWSEPVETFLSSKSSDTNAATDNAYNALLRTFLEEMCTTWNETCTNYDDDFEYFEKPWLLCEIKNRLTYPGLNGLDSGLCKFSLMVGKLNVCLGHLSILSMAVLLGQIWYALKLVEDKRLKARSHPILPSGNEQEIFWEGKYESLISRMKKILLKLFPEKRIQVGMFITGPHIQMSTSNIGSASGNKNRKVLVREDDFQIGFDIHDIEVVVRPTAKSDLELNLLSDGDDAVTECCRLQERHIIEIPKSETEKYASHSIFSLRLYLRVNGLNVYMGDTKELQDSQIIVLKPIAVESSFFRQSVHTFSTTTIALSSALCGRAAGFTIICYMNELHAFFQVVADLLSAITCALNGFLRTGFVPFQDFIMQTELFPDPVSDEINVEGDSLVCGSTLFSINGRFHFKSMEVVLLATGTSNKRASAKKAYDVSHLQKLFVPELHGRGVWLSVHHYCIGMVYEEEKVEISGDLFGTQSIIFKYLDQMGKTFDGLVAEYLYRRSENWLYEFSLPSFSFTLCLDYPRNRMNNLFGESSSDRMSNLFGESSSDSNMPNRVEVSQVIRDSEISRAQSSRFGSSDFASNVSGPNSNHWILLSVIVSEMFIARHLTKKIVVQSHQFNKFTSLISTGGNFQTVSWRMQHWRFSLNALLFISKV